jgi:hypothetical protein
MEPVPPRLRSQKRQAKLSGRAESSLDILVVSPVLEKNENRAIGALPGISALDSAGAVPEKRLTPGAADLDGIGHGCLELCTVRLRGLRNEP